MRRTASLLALASLAWTSSALAQAAPSEWRSESYYAVNGAVTAALIGGRALTGLLGKQLEAGHDTVWFPGDAGLRGRCSPQAAHLSDVTFALAIALPPAMELGGGLNARFVNAEVVYTQALFAAGLLTSVAKVTFRRPRPFSYRKEGCSFQVEDPDPNRSFFSGHSSGVFVSAFAGSFLMSEHADRRTRAAIWGTEMALAGATANLRARAGKHYYSDIVVGALVGAGIGLAIPALHGADAPPRASDLLAGSIGLAVGVVGSQLVAIGAEVVDAPGGAGVELSPWFVAGGQGMMARGSW
ncbi:MAG TPA: phosphatase PAP2 family protein [Polyangiaceae bacterium]|nr:phosphatase PAP2 family protein [Polyangiaceae bacterium]